MQQTIIKIQQTHHQQILINVSYFLWLLFLEFGENLHDNEGPLPVQRINQEIKINVTQIELPENHTPMVVSKLREINNLANKLKKII